MTDDIKVCVCEPRTLVDSFYAGICSCGRTRWIDLCECGGIQVVDGHTKEEMLEALKDERN